MTEYKQILEQYNNDHNAVATAVTEMAKKFKEKVFGLSGLLRDSFKFTNSRDQFMIFNSRLVSLLNIKFNFRTRLVEDGYRQLSSLSSSALKGVIRVKFVNLQVRALYVYDVRTLYTLLCTLYSTVRAFSFRLRETFHLK